MSLNTEHRTINEMEKGNSFIKRTYTLLARLIIYLIFYYIIYRNGHSFLQPLGLAQLGDAALAVPESSQLWSAEGTL